MGRVYGWAKPCMPWSIPERLGHCEKRRYSLASAARLFTSPEGPNVKNTSLPLQHQHCVWTFHKCFTASVCPMHCSQAWSNSHCYVIIETLDTSLHSLQLTGVLLQGKNFGLLEVREHAARPSGTQLMSIPLLPSEEDQVHGLSQLSIDQVTCFTSEQAKDMGSAAVLPSKPRSAVGTADHTANS